MFFFGAFLKITLFGEAFKMCLARSLPKDSQLRCHQRAEETAAKAYLILKGLSHQSAVCGLHWWIVGRYGKETPIEGNSCW